METCWLCEIHPIYSKIKPLCHVCYSACRAKGLLHIFPSLNSENKSIESAIKKYGVGFQEDMNTLHAGKATLASVGDKYGISRERVRQLYQIFFHEKYTIVVKEKTAINIVVKEKTAINHEIRVQKHIEYGKFENRLNRHKKHCTRYTGIIAEHLFNEKCKSLGYVVEMQSGKSLFDAIVNGIPVDVKSRSEAARYATNCHNLYYHFNSNKKQREAVKYFPLYLIDEDSWYIIPSCEMKSGTFFVPKYDITHGGQHKYQDIQKYREAWHLLRGS